MSQNGFSALMHALWWRRAVFASLVTGSVVTGDYLLWDMLRLNGFGALDAVILLLFSISFLWISYSFWTGFIGFLVQVLADNPVAYTTPIINKATQQIDPGSRIAVVMPIYNEDVERVFAGMRATYQSVLATGCSAQFDFVLLSDTTDQAILDEEQRRMDDAKRHNLFGGRLRYSRRWTKEGGKAGNIAAFCERFGTHYRYMAVLDADSIMSGETLVRLACILEGNPQVGILQAVRRLANQETPFARFIQFGTRTSSAMFTLGQCFWQMGSGVYSGHNAMIRVDLFTAHCELPQLPGRGPLSGKILSHDFVESALMCRAGYEVWNLAEGEGSYEEVPTNIVDYAARDRRWCQGNLQHLRLVGMKGLPLTSRFQLAVGALAYLSSAVWLMLLTIGLLLGVTDNWHWSGVAQGDGAIYPVWSIAKPGQSVLLLIITIIMLLLPKVLAVVTVLRQPQERSAYGGTGALCLSAVLEIVLAAILAPVLMLHHSALMVSILSGRSVRWTTQERDSRRLDFGESLARHRGHLALGLTLAGCILYLSPNPSLLWWFSPVIFGLLLSVPLAMLSSRADLGLQMRRCGLFLIPEETSPPTELVDFDDFVLGLRVAA